MTFHKFLRLLSILCNSTLMEQNMQRPIIVLTNGHSWKFESLLQFCRVVSNKDVYLNDHLTLHTTSKSGELQTSLPYHYRKLKA